MYRVTVYDPDGAITHDDVVDAPNEWDALNTVGDYDEYEVGWSREHPEHDEPYWVMARPDGSRITVALLAESDA